MAVFFGLGFLAVAQVLTALGDAHQAEAGDARLSALTQRIGQNTTDIERLSRSGQEHERRLSEVIKRVKSAEDSQAETSLPGSTSDRKPVANPASPSRMAAFPPPAAAAGRRLFLEPVVRLAEGRTAYYKASLQSVGPVTGGPLQPVVSTDLRPSGNKSPVQAAQLDRYILEQVLPLIDTLRARRGASGIFCPISAATLDDMGALMAYVDVLRNNGEAAQGIVIDMNHGVMAGLSEAGMRGLAWLASMGAVMSLTGPAPANNDLAALAELGFAFIDAPSTTLLPANRSNSSSCWALVQAASVHNITLIASGVQQSSQASGLLRVASLARGPGFALPRAVRNSSTESAGSERVA
jgi:EAL domain-containing protein (putative c-di-GMP-specific phosphodiesterase class I)